MSLLLQARTAARRCPRAASRMLAIHVTIVPSTHSSEAPIGVHRRGGVLSLQALRAPCLRCLSLPVQRVTCLLRISGLQVPLLAPHPAHTHTKGLAPWHQCALPATGSKAGGDDPPQPKPAPAAEGGVSGCCPCMGHAAPSSPFGGPPFACSRPVLAPPPSPLLRSTCPCQCY